MDKKRGLLNVSVSIAFRVILLIGSVLVRRFLINYISNDINGLNSLYVSILDVLSVAELGIDSAIVFCMYTPVVEGDNDKVSALYHLFTKLYLICGVIIIVGGCALMPALPYFAKDYENTGVNLYLTFGLMLISVVISYVFSSKSSLINAYKNNYITATVSSLSMVLRYALQITVLILTRSFVWYLVCRIIAVSVQGIATEIIARKKYGFIINNKKKTDADTRKSAVKNIKAMFMHKIGYALVNTVDSIIISAFIGIVVLGKYTNYITIVTAMTGIITLFFTPLTSVIGHMFVEEDAKHANKYFNFFHAFNFVLGTVFFLGYYAVIDNLVAILFRADLVMVKTISFVITVNYFIQFMRRSTILFRDASGTFYNNRWMPICEGGVNLGLSILFVSVFPEDYNIVGVIVATIITNIFICHIVEPHVLYKYALKAKAKTYYIRNYAYIIIFAAALVALNYTMIATDNQWAALFANGGISLAYSIAISLAVILINKDFRHYATAMLDKLKRRRVTAVETTAAGDTKSEPLDVTNESGSPETETPPEQAPSEDKIDLHDQID